MFHLHETTRRYACRTVFVLLCILPTGATLGWIGAARRPNRVADEQTRLAGALHAAVELADWCTPRPGAARTSMLILRAPATDAPVLQLRELSMSGDASCHVVQATEATIDGGHLPQLVSRLDGWLAAQSAGVVETKLRIGRVVISRGSAGASVEFHNVEVRATRVATGYQCRIVAQAAGGDGELAQSLPVRVTVQHAGGADGRPPTVVAEVDFAAAPVPAWLLSALVPGLGSLGDAAKFSGTLVCESSAGVVSGRATGRVTGVSLAAVIPASSGHRAAGTAELQLDHMRWRGGVVQHIAGTLTCDGVVASRSLLALATARLFCVQASPGVASTRDAEMLALDQLACRFDMDESGLALAGAIPATERLPEGCIATSGGHALLLAPAHDRVAAAAWAQFLGGSLQSWVPATREAVDIAGALPLPGDVK